MYVISIYRQMQKIAEDGDKKAKYFDPDFSMKEAVRKRQDRKERTPAQIERYLFYWLVKNL